MDCKRGESIRWVGDLQSLLAMTVQVACASAPLPALPRQRRLASDAPNVLPAVSDIAHPSGTVMLETKRIRKWTSSTGEHTGNHSLT